MFRGAIARGSWLAAAALSGLGAVAGIWLSLTTGFIWLWIRGAPWAIASLLVGLLLIVLQQSAGLTRSRRLVVLSFVLPVSVIVTDWPFRLALALSRPALRELAETKRFDTPERTGFLGVFPVRGVGKKDAAVAFWTDLHPYGYSGLVYSPSGRPPFNTWSEQALGNGWYFIVED